MMSFNCISVIIPVYNAEKTLDKCLESVVAQTFKQLEIILINDGSTDASQRICEDWKNKDSRIKYVCKENGGVSSARNAGLEVATGNYIAFVDSDDYLKSNMFEYMLELITEYQADIARVSYYIVEKDTSLVIGEPDDSVRVYHNEDILTTLSKSGHKSVVLWNKLICRSLIGDIRFQEDLIVGEDLLFLYQVLKNAGTMVSHDIPLYYYYLSDNQCSSRNDFNYEGFRAMKRIIEDKDCPEAFYYRYFIFGSMLLHDIVLNGFNEDFKSVRKQILLNKKQIKRVVTDKNNRIKLSLLSLSGGLYKLLLKVRG